MASINWMRQLLVHFSPRYTLPLLPQPSCFSGATAVGELFPVLCVVFHFPVPDAIKLNQLDKNRVEGKKLFGLWQKTRKGGTANGKTKKNLIQPLRLVCLLLRPHTPPLPQFCNWKCWVQLRNLKSGCNSAVSFKLSCLFFRYVELVGKPAMGKWEKNCTYPVSCTICERRFHQWLPVRKSNWVIDTVHDTESEVAMINSPFPSVFSFEFVVDMLERGGHSDWRRDARGQLINAGAIVNLSSGRNFGRNCSSSSQWMKRWLFLHPPAAETQLS